MSSIFDEKKNNFSVPLGSLVINPQKPAREYLDLTLGQVNPHIAIKTKVAAGENAQYSFTNEQNAKHKLNSLLLSGTYTSSKSDNTSIVGTKQHVYQVSNSEVLLKSALERRGKTGVFSWLWKQALPWQKVYMIVGYCILTDPKVEATTTYESILEAHIQDPLSTICRLTGFGSLPEFSLKATFSIKTWQKKKSLVAIQATGEFVWAVQYQRVGSIWNICSYNERRRDTKWDLTAIVPGYIQDTGWKPFEGDSLDTGNEKGDEIDIKSRSCTFNDPEYGGFSKFRMQFGGSFQFSF